MVALAACGGSSPGPGATATPPPAPAPVTPDPTTATGPTDSRSPTGPTSPTSTSPYLPSPEPELTVPATRLGRLERLTGVVGRGVEHGCLMLTPRGGGQALQLLVEDKRVVEGAGVTVEGYRVTGMASTCQQGVPFSVTKVVDIRPGGG